MQRLRKLSFLSRLVLAWFALSIGVAAASPLFNPAAMDLICSSSGVIEVPIEGPDGTGSKAGHSLDCPLCASLDSPPPPPVQAITQAHSLEHVLGSIPAARIAWLTAAPLPARGPPELS